MQETSIQNYDNFCSICQNREFSLDEGILCKLTHKKPAFTDECLDFILDPDREKREHYEQQRLEAVGARTGDDLEYGSNAQGTPLKPINLLNLFARPREFFASPLKFGNVPCLIFVLICFGIANVVDRIDAQLFKLEFGSKPSDLYLVVAYSWQAFWLLSIFMGAISGIFIWLIGGWWFKMRLIWSGALKPNKKMARYVYIYSSFVHTGPTFLMILLYTAIYPDYFTAYSEDFVLSFAIAILVFYSIIVSYIGATTVFDLVTWKARWWFIILPVLFYLIFLGVIGYIFPAMGS